LGRMENARMRGGSWRRCLGIMENPKMGEEVGDNVGKNGEYKNVGKRLEEMFGMMETARIGGGGCRRY
jgi:hypothetical protein